jgi:hypothetical protein
MSVSLQRCQRQRGEASWAARYLPRDGTEAALEKSGQVKVRTMSTSLPRTRPSLRAQQRKPADI